MTLDASGWREEVLALVQAEIEKRGVDADVVALVSETSAEAPEEREQEVIKGTGGWLGYLIGVLVFVGPVRFVLLLADVASIPFQRIDVSRAEIFLALLGDLTQAGVLAYLFFCGIALWREMPGSVLHTQRALVAIAVVTGVVQLVTGTILFAVGAVFAPLIWIAYLRKSQRVLNTYPSWALHMRSKGLDAG